MIKISRLKILDAKFAFFCYRKYFSKLKVNLKEGFVNSVITEGPKTKVSVLLFLLECGKVVNNSLKSPGYPKKYPKSMHCVYSVNIPRGKEMKIDFVDFEMEDGHSCL